MADSCRANPAYQLDVDEMVLDYLVYKCIEAQFRLQQLTLPEDNDTAALAATREESLRLLNIFEAFMQLFRTNHPDKSLPENMPFNVKVLEFLVLFGNRRTVRAAAGLDAEALDSLVKSQGDMFLLRHEQQLKAHPDNDVVASWLRPWVGFKPRPPNHQAQTSSAATDAEPSIVFPLVFLTPLLLEVAAETVAVLEQTPNDTFLELAANFMLQAAIEILLDQDLFHQLSMVRYHAAVEQSDEDDYAIVESMEDADYDAGVFIRAAFAWSAERVKAEEEKHMDFEDIGDETYVRPPRRKPSASLNLESENLIASMFRDPSTDRELEEWRMTRRRYLSLFDISNTTARSYESACRECLKSAHERFPVTELNADVLRFVDYIWHLVGNGANQNVPVLVQIEQGRLENLDDMEFTEFMRRVGGRPHLDILEKIEMPVDGRILPGLYSS